LSIGAQGQKTRMMGLPGRERSLTISSVVWIQYTNMKGRRTLGDSKDRALTHRTVINTKLQVTHKKQVITRVNTAHNIIKIIKQTKQFK